MGFIYLLYNDEGKGYIGRTKNIERRIYGHKSNKNTTNSKLLGTFKCEILEICENDCLYDYERYYYDMYNEMFPNMIVNERIPLQTQKEWYENNADRLSALQKERNKKNPEKKVEQRKKWLENNAEKMKQYQKKIL
jgi:predicted GIY-YIG superfamily endonuclease